jgi:hypothetical protein
MAAPLPSDNSKFCPRLGVDRLPALGEVAIALMLQNPEVTGAIAGMRNSKVVAGVGGTGTTKP